MRVLVTGGAGFIGSHIVDLLIEQGHDVMVVDDLSTGRRENLTHEVAFGQVDITKFEELEIFVGYFNPTHICHQAAQASLLRSEQYPDLDAEINILGTLNIIKLARKFNARVVMASTSAVYEDSISLFTEQSRCKPNRPYGISKYAAERYLEWSGLSYAILRYGNVYGPRQVPVGENQLVPRALDGLFRGKPFTIYGDGTHSRDFVYVGDVARANLAALQSSENGIFNVSTGVSTSVNKLLQHLEMLTDLPVAFPHTPAKPGEPDYVCLGPYRANELLHWRAQVDLKQGLKNTLAWYRQAYL
jgi:UDP-glucose 4-epimerase